MFEPKTRRFIIIGIILIFALIMIFFTVTVSIGTLGGDDVVNIIKAIAGIFKKAPELVK